LDDYYSNLQKVDETKRVLRGIKINQDLMEHLNSTIRWLLHFCQKNNIDPPNLDQLQSSIEKAQNYLTELPSHPTTFYKENNRRDLDRTHFH